MPKRVSPSRRRSRSPPHSSLSDEARAYKAKRERKSAKKSLQRRRYAEDQSAPIQSFRRLRMWEQLENLKAKEDENLTAEEQELFDSLIDALYRNPRV